MNTPDFSEYLCQPEHVQARINLIDPRAYDKTRNHLDGKVTWLSPFLTHGICSTGKIASSVLQQYPPKKAYRLLYELGWREFFHRTWQIEEDVIFSDMRHPQSGAMNSDLPTAIVQATTGIDTIDQCLLRLFETGLMHNHARMWVASIICNLARTHWPEPARWLHCHLLDGDMASNTLSWQWIAGTFSHKKYFANQANINKYSSSKQTDTWLDVPYEAFDDFLLPEHMQARSGSSSGAELIPGEPVTPISGKLALRSIWNLDPQWQRHVKQHVVFVDTDWYAHWPMSQNRWAFIMHWADVCKARLVYGTLQQLKRCTFDADVVRQEYPACAHWPGKVTERDWLYPLPDDSFPSFSRYFKQVKSHVGL
ncbi:MAG: FAD-binding domain-containing protein [Granulosicoccus sp.]